MCAEWLAYCLSIGWRREDLDALERIWWSVRNPDGSLKRHWR